MALKIRDFLLAVLLTGILGYSDSFSVLEADSKNDDTLTCYSCNSAEGKCGDMISGVEKQCKAGQGCYFSLEKIPGGESIYRRDCSSGTDEPDMCDEEDDEGGSTRSCHCSTNLCNKNWVDAGSTEKPADPTEAPHQSMKCYTCDSHEGECSAEQFGIETDCAGGFGCLISLETRPDTDDFFVRECLAMAEDEYKCETETTEDGMTIHSCQCAGELCNKNWVEAGSTEQPDGPTDAPTDPSHQPIKCYKCHSNENENGCSDEESGEVNECVDGYGCLISKETRPDGNDFFLRDCVAIPDTEYKCETITTDEGTTLHTCSCAAELCNKDWAEAGSTEQPDGPTDAPTEPAVKTVKCYSCDSNSDSCDEENPGTETDCEVERGCNIMTNKDLYTRGCSVNEEPGCTEEADTRSCNCLSALCNFNWVTAGAEDKIKCYSCDSNEGECDDAHAGTEIDCAVEAGCSISTDVSDGKTLFVRGCSGELEPTPGCTNEGDATTCFCMNALCNFDWNSAGSTTDSSDTTKPTESTSQGPTLHCYKCDSTAGDCTEEARGEDVECPEAKGCTIGKTTGTDGDDVLIRDCSTEKDALCDTIDNGDGKGTTQFCNCDSSLCNGDWSSAGSTEVPPPVTTTAGTPAAETTAPTDAPTDAPGAANRMSSVIAIALGLGAALVLSSL